MFAPLTGFLNTYSTTETEEPAANGPNVAPKRSNESTVTKQRQRSKSEQQTKVAQRKSEREQRESKRAQHAIASIFEAAGDKPVLSPPILSGQDLQKAIEAVGDKDVVLAPTDPQEDWQQALYQEFLRWQLRQLIP
jgi:alpha-amylase/alpha-mannosidase (GH57 family)